MSPLVLRAIFSHTEILAPTPGFLFTNLPSTATSREGLRIHMIPQYLVDLLDDSEDVFVASLKMLCERHDQCFLAII